MIAPTIEAPTEATSTAALPMSSELPRCGSLWWVMALAIDSRALLNISAVNHAGDAQHQQAPLVQIHPQHQPRRRPRRRRRRNGRRSCSARARLPSRRGRRRGTCGTRNVRAGVMSWTWRGMVNSEQSENPGLDLAAVIGISFVSFRTRKSGGRCFHPTSLFRITTSTRESDFLAWAKSAFGFGVVALFLVGNATVVVCLSIVRVDSDRFGEVRDGLVEVALLRVGNAPAVIRLGILRVEPDGLGVVGDALVEFALLRVGIAPCRTPSASFGSSRMASV